MTEHQISQVLSEYHRHTSDASVLNLFYTLGVEGSLDLDALRACFASLLQSYPQLGNFDPWDATHFQVISFGADQPETKLAVLIESERRQILDPDIQRLLRVTYVSLAPNRGVLVLTFHHKSCDALSLRLYARHLSAHYAALAGDYEIPVVGHTGPLSRVKSVELSCDLETLRVMFDGLRECAVDPFREVSPDYSRRLFFTRTVGSEGMQAIREAAASKRGTPFALIISSVAGAVRDICSAAGIVLGTIVTTRRTSWDMAQGGAFYRGALLSLTSTEVSFAAKALAMAVDRSCTYQDERSILSEVLGEKHPVDPAIFVSADDAPLQCLSLTGATLFPVTVGRNDPKEPREAHTPVCGRIAFHWRSHPSGGALSIFFEPALQAVGMNIYDAAFRRLATLTNNELAEAPSETWFGPLIRHSVLSADAVSPVKLPNGVLQ